MKNNKFKTGGKLQGSLGNLVIEKIEEVIVRDPDGTIRFILDEPKIAETVIDHSRITETLKGKHERG